MVLGVIITEALEKPGLQPSSTLHPPPVPGSFVLVFGALGARTRPPGNPRRGRRAEAQVGNACVSAAGVAPWTACRVCPACVLSAWPRGSPWPLLLGRCPQPPSSFSVSCASACSRGLALCGFCSLPPPVGSRLCRAPCGCSGPFLRGLGRGISGIWSWLDRVRCQATLQVSGVALTSLSAVPLESVAKPQSSWLFVASCSVT